MSICLRRRDFVAVLGGAAVWPLAARAQRPALPLIAFITGSAKNGPVEEEAAFRKGLAEAGYVDGQNTGVLVPNGRKRSRGQGYRPSVDASTCGLGFEQECAV
jgi:hypothetical protein